MEGLKSCLFLGLLAACICPLKKSNWELWKHLLVYLWNSNKAIASECKTVIFQLLFYQSRITLAWQFFIAFFFREKKCGKIKQKFPIFIIFNELIIWNAERTASTAGTSCTQHPGTPSSDPRAWQRLLQVLSSGELQRSPVTVLPEALATLLPRFNHFKAGMQLRAVRCIHILVQASLPSASRFLSSLQAQSLWPLQNRCPLQPAKALVTTNFFVPMNVTNLGPSYDWNYAAFILLHLAHLI